MPFICWCYTAFATILVWGSVFGTFGFDDIENNSFISVTKFGVITHMYQSSHMVRRINTQLSIITWSTVASLHYVSEMQSLKKIGSESCIYGQKGTLIKKIKGQAFLNAISVTCPLTLKRYINYADDMIPFWQSFNHRSFLFRIFSLSFFLSLQIKRKQ